jgi:uncharacterized protein (DUF2267 family)
MQPHIDALDRSTQQTLRWLDEIAGLLESQDRQTAYHALRAVLVNLRDRIGTENAAKLAAQLPTFIRGVFYEDFHPAATPTRERSRDAFLAKVDRSATGKVHLDPEQAVRAVLKVMAWHLDPAEVAKVSGMLPEELWDLWPEEAPVRASAHP